MHWKGWVKKYVTHRVQMQFIWQGDPQTYGRVQSVTAQLWPTLQQPTELYVQPTASLHHRAFQLKYSAAAAYLYNTL